MARRCGKNGSLRTRRSARLRPRSRSATTRVVERALRYVGHIIGDRAVLVATGDAHAAKNDVAGRDGSKPGKRLCQRVLTVAGDAGDAKNFAARPFRRRRCESARLAQSRTRRSTCRSRNRCRQRRPEPRLRRESVATDHRAHELLGRPLARQARDRRRGRRA